MVVLTVWMDLMKWTVSNSYPGPTIGHHGDLPLVTSNSTVSLKILSFQLLLPSHCVLLKLNNMKLLTVGNWI